MFYLVYGTELYYEKVDDNYIFDDFSETDILYEVDKELDPDEKSIMGSEYTIFYIQEDYPDEYVKDFTNNIFEESIILMGF